MEAQKSTENQKKKLLDMPSSTGDHGKELRMNVDADEDKTMNFPRPDDSEDDDEKARMEAKKKAFEKFLDMCSAVDEGKEVDINNMHPDKVKMMNFLLQFKDKESRIEAFKKLCKEGREQGDMLLIKIKKLGIEIDECFARSESILARLEREEKQLRSMLTTYK